MNNIELEEFELIIDIINKFSEITKDWQTKNYLSLNERELILLCFATKTPQSYGSIFQNVFASKYKLIKVNAKKQKGDLTNGTEFFEYKMSVLKPNKNSANIVQIRLFHEVNYIIEIFDIRNLKNIQKYQLYLTNEQMKVECNKLAHSAHGLIENATEFRLDLKYNSDDFNRWINCYSFNEEKIRRK